MIHVGCSESASKGRRTSASGSSVAASHILTVLSLDPETTRRPSGKTATLKT